MLLTIIIIHSNTHSAVISLHALIMTFCMESISIHIIGIPRPHLSTMTDGQSPNNIIFIVRLLQKNIYTVSYLLHACSVFFINVSVKQSFTFDLNHSTNILDTDTSMVFLE